MYDLKYDRRAKVLRVIDGDTVDLEWIDLGFGRKQYPLPDEPIRLRFAGMNAFETSLRYGTTEEQKAKGILARDWLREEVEGKTVIIRTVKGGDRGSFGRLLVWIWPDEEGPSPLPEVTSYNAAIVDRGWGVWSEG